MFGRGTRQSFVSLTTRRDGETIVRTADYFIIPGAFPCTVAVFKCPCGATTVEYDVRRVVPPGWGTTEDGSPQCPHCLKRPPKR